MRYLFKSRIMAVCLLLLWALCACGSEPGELLLTMAPDAEESLQPVQEAEETSAVEILSEIYVYVCGAVTKPGVVCLPEGSRADAALEAAGGFRADAAIDVVNLAARLSDGEKLYFPTQAEAESSVAQEIETALVNINTADREMLCSLPGIGETRAEDILRYREENGPFESCEEIMLVPGIKTSVYNKIRERITVK